MRREQVRDARGVLKSIWNGGEEKAVLRKRIISCSPGTLAWCEKKERVGEDEGKIR